MTALKVLKLVEEDSSLLFHKIKHLKHIQAFGGQFCETHARAFFNYY